MTDVKESGDTVANIMLAGMASTMIKCSFNVFKQCIFLAVGLTTAGKSQEMILKMATVKLGAFFPFDWRSGQ